MYDYIPIRVFDSDGDVHHFILATGISPWLIYAVGGSLVLWGIVDFYRFVLPRSLRACGLDSRAARAAVLIVATALLFGYFTIPGLEEADDMSQLIARTSLLAIPVVIAMLWQRTVAADLQPRASPPGASPGPGAAAVAAEPS